MVVSMPRPPMNERKKKATPRTSIPKINPVTRKKKNKQLTSVGNYTIEETLGEGTFGKVKKGTHILTGERVAIKILEKSKIKTEADLTRITREIKILKRIHHVNCIRLLEVIDTPQQIFLMTEFLDGGEIFDYIVKRSRLAENEASVFLGQILDGLEYLHKNHVIHRDLKPENLLLQRQIDGSWGIKIADYGLSNTNEENILLKTACGSPCYAAPEMIAGKHYEGSKSDIWSLGVVLYALICGYLPFEDGDTSVLYRKILGAKYKCPRFLSIEAQDLLSKILDTNPSTRITIAGIRNHVWMRKHEQLVKNQVTPPVNSKLGAYDEEIIRKLILLGLDTDFITASLSQCLHNSATTSYFLLAEKKRFMTNQIEKLPSQLEDIGTSVEKLDGMESRTEKVEEIEPSCAKVENIKPPAENLQDFEPPVEKVQETSIQEKIQEISIQEKIQETSIQEKIQETSIQEKIQETSIQEKIQETSIQEKIQETSIQEKTQETPIQEKIQETPIQEKIQETPIQEKIEIEESKVDVAEDFDLEIEKLAAQVEKLSETVENRNIDCKTASKQKVDAEIKVEKENHIQAPERPRMSYPSRSRAPNSQRNVVDLKP